MSNAGKAKGTYNPGTLNWMTWLTLLVGSGRHRQKVEYLGRGGRQEKVGEEGEGWGEGGHSGFGGNLLRQPEPRGTPEDYGGFLGDQATVADGELFAMQLALSTEDAELLTILSDSQAAIQAVRNMNTGSPPRCDIEKEIKARVVSNPHRDLQLAWVRGHLGIPGNEKAGRIADFQSHLGEVTGHRCMVTEGGLRASSKAIRKEARMKAGYGIRRVDWNRHALSAYTWLRTNRGPQKSLLHHIGKAESAECACGYPSETGEHIVFRCPRFDWSRRALLGEKSSWEELDKPDWRKEEEETYEATEAFFGFLEGMLPIFTNFLCLSP
ncbi:hypothetical protein BGX38DRAFT_1269417 [Terfezia claveryi]|nr:hypothetical protein BGX38DRAFT_1269417 [Terfezia claveryi]